MYNLYPFGSPLPTRTYQSGEYRYGFNGKEQDNDMGNTAGAVYDYGFRIYDSRIAKFTSVDPLFKNFAFYSPYHFAGGNPIKYVDLDGLETIALPEGFVTPKTLVNNNVTEAQANLISEAVNGGLNVNEFNANADKILQYSEWEQKYRAQMDADREKNSVYFLAGTGTVLGIGALIAIGPKAVATFLIEEGVEYIIEKQTGVLVIMGPVDIAQAIIKKFGKKVSLNVVEQSSEKVIKESTEDALNESTEKAYRYVGKSEKKIIDKTGEIPNVDADGNLKEIYYTNKNYKTAGRAKTHNQLPKKPSYKVEIDPSNIKGGSDYTRVNKTDNPQWGKGGGVEASTPKPIKVDPSKIVKLKGAR